MRQTLAILVLTLTTILGVAPAAGAKPHSPDNAVASTDLAGSMLTVSPSIPFVRATLRVAGPDSYEAVAWSTGGSLALDLATDGFFSDSEIEGASVSPLPDGRYGYEAIFHRADGTRRIHHGVFFVEGGVARREASDRQAGRTIPAEVSAHEAEDDGGLTNVSAKSDAEHADDFFTISPDITTDSFLSLRSTSAPPNLGTRLRLWNRAGALQVANSVVNVSGEPLVEYHPLMTLVLTSVDQARLGIGTHEPQADLDVRGPGGRVRITDTGACPNPAASWEIEEDFGKLKFEVVPNCEGDPVGGKMWITGSGNVGIGNPAPSARLHVAGGAILEGDVALGSSRTIKHEIEPLDGVEILSAIRELPLYSWKYREDPAQASHVGPMAEDIHAAFRLGSDEKHLSPSDSAGLALAAVQGLDQRVEARLDELRETVELLAATNRELSSDNDRLRARLEAIESGLGASASEEPQR